MPRRPAAAPMPPRRTAWRIRFAHPQQAERQRREQVEGTKLRSIAQTKTLHQRTGLERFAGRQHREQPRHRIGYLVGYLVGAAPIGPQALPRVAATVPSQSPKLLVSAPRTASCVNLAVAPIKRRTSYGTSTIQLRTQVTCAPRCWPSPAHGAPWRRRDRPLTKCSFAAALDPGEACYGFVGSIRSFSSPSLVTRTERTCSAA